MKNMKATVLGKVKEYFTALKELSDYNEQWYHDHPEKHDIMCLWKDSSGFTHLLTYPSCPVCKHCTDVWIDSITTEIYKCECDVVKDVKGCKDCVHFEKEVEEPC